MLYDVIFTRRQVRKFNTDLVESETVDSIAEHIYSTRQMDGLNADFEVVPAQAISGSQGAAFAILSYCGNNAFDYANVGFVLQEADLYIQNIGLGSGWFMSAKPNNSRDDFCIALLFGGTDVPFRKGAGEFKRKPISEICSESNNIAEAVRLAPSSMNSQPWRLSFSEGRVIVEEAGRGIARMILKNKLNKIDMGIASRHAVTTLENDGKTITRVEPVQRDKKFLIEISYE